MKALILAGGLGARLRPLTFAVPKPLIPVRGKPIIDYIISRLSQFGFGDIYISLNYKAEIIKLYLQEKIQNGLSVTYLQESAPLGTAGPLALFKKNKVSLQDNETVLVINGDIMTNLDFGRFFQEHDRSNNDLTVGMINYSHTLAYGVLDLDENNNIVTVKEKPTFQYKASAGIYLVRKSCVDLVPDGYFTMPELIKVSRQKNRQVRGFQIEDHWLAIEQIKNLEEVQEEKEGDWISRL